MSQENKKEKCIRCGLPKKDWKGRWQDPLCKVGKTSYDLHTFEPQEYNLASTEVKEECDCWRTGDSCTKCGQSSFERNERCNEHGMAPVKDMKNEMEELITQLEYGIDREGEVDRTVFRNQLNIFLDKALAQQRKEIGEKLKDGNLITHFTGGSSVEPKDIRVKLVDAISLINQ